MTAALDILVRPRRAASALGPDHRVGRNAVLVTAGLYAVFCVWLGATGHQPSFTGVPIPAEAYYWAQAVFVTPLFLVAWRAGAAVTTRLAGIDDATPHGPHVVRQMLGVTWGASMSLGYVLPDLLVFGAAGFDALAPAMRVYGPIALLGILVLGARAVAAVAPSRPRAWVAHVLGVLTQSAIIATLLR